MLSVVEQVLKYLVDKLRQYHSVEILFYKDNSCMQGKEQKN